MNGTYVLMNEKPPVQGISADLAIAGTVNIDHPVTYIHF
jgi:hypothetical protein